MGITYGAQPVKVDPTMLGVISTTSGALPVIVDLDLSVTRSGVTLYHCSATRRTAGHVKGQVIWAPMDIIVLAGTRVSETLSKSAKQRARKAKSAAFKAASEATQSRIAARETVSPSVEYGADWKAGRDVINMGELFG